MSGRAVGRRWGWALLLIAALAGAWGIRSLGRWLIVADPLDRARAIVVLTGDFPFRAIEAAALYKQGWAPEIWLQQTAASAREAALARLGFDMVGEGHEEHSNHSVLARLGVPSDAVRVLDRRVQNTVQELRAVAEELRRVDGSVVIVVTSKPHSRRVRATWRAVVGRSPRAVVRYALDDPYDPSRWWANTRDALSVSREVFGLMNVWTGFPVQPDSGG